MQNYHSTTSLSVLLVDDTAVNRLVAGSILKELGCQVAEATNGKEAVEAVISDTDYDLVLMDINMPVMSGLEAIHVIRTVESSDSHTTVVALTASDAERQQLNNVGFDDILPKPVTVDNLTTLLQKHFPSFQKAIHTNAMLAPASATARVASTSVDKSHYNILLVEDNQVNCIVATNMLNALGYQTDVVYNGCEAVTACANKQYDLLLMDIRMPTMDGTEATQLIREYPNYADTPIIAVTANTSATDLILYKQVGMNECLPKPLTIETLRNILDKYLTTTKPNQPELLQHDFSSFTILDRPFLQKVTLNNPKLMVLLLKKFITETSNQLNSIAFATVNQNQELLIRASHSIKGGARSIGANRLGEVAAYMETDMMEGVVQTAAVYLDRLKAEFAQLQVEIQQVIEDNT
ncbi:response regulator containing a CheY-like receiver domain and a GGDEF domain [Beggiatoa alba B18LD]|uniref:Response regulator containing a CheY-like receiver domain and a GGDEF domain n=1 Tax=Beggiatoa alba B18LD TaxID=395493 RepID=I3CKM1_9GAMM|nr:response regulator [Beggiatoa alba]EIJ44164.1 response regulator containing a CheY-like receiver domain and a GGDEF domain [Beggiatoa alba B18LD]